MHHLKQTSEAPSHVQTDNGTCLQSIGCQTLSNMFDDWIASSNSGNVQPRRHQEF